MVVAVRSLFLGVVTGNDLRGQNKIVDQRLFLWT